MENADRFLVTFYWKTRNYPARGAAPEVIRRLLHLPSSELPAILYLLSEQQLIKMDAGYGDNLVITGQGIQQAKTLIRNLDLSILVFYSAQHIPPTNRLVFGYNYSYLLFSPDGSEKNGSVGVFVSDVAAMTLRLSFTKDGSGEKLLLQYGRDWVADKHRKARLGSMRNDLL